jgi:predicted metal-dependent peptidase
MKVDTSERLRDLIIQLTFADSYWGYLFSRVRRIELKMPYAMGVSPTSDGTINLLYDKEKVDGSDDFTIIKILEHEGMHILNKHISRFFRILADEISDYEKERKKGIMMYAADMAVNTQMSIPKVLKVGGRDYPLVFPDSYDLPPKNTMEFYYMELLKKSNQSQPKMMKMVKSGSKGQQGEGGNQSGEQDNQSGQGQEEGSQSGDGNDQSGDGKGKLLDDHSKWIEAAEECEDLHSMSRKLDNFSTNIVLEAYRSVSDRGKIPAGIIQMIQDALAPARAPYYQIIRKLVRGSRMTKFERCFTRINRKRTYAFTIGSDPNKPVICPFPGKSRDFSFDIGILLDSSGSMSLEDIMEGLSGVKNIIENDRHCKTTIIECDAQIQKEYVCKRLKDIDFQIKGRGGTTLFPALSRFKDLDVDVVLAFTDGYCESINNIARRLLPKKIIWVITNNRGTAENINKTGFVVTLDK